MSSLSSSSSSSSSQKRQMLQPWPIFLTFLNSKDRSILPQRDYTRVRKSISRSGTTSSSIASDCASNTTLVTNASPFNSQTVLSNELCERNRIAVEREKKEEERRTIKCSENKNSKSETGVSKPEVHYYTGNLLNNQNLTTNQLYNHHHHNNNCQIKKRAEQEEEEEEEDSKSSDYEQLNPLLSRNNNHHHQIQPSKMFNSQEFQVKMTSGPTFSNYVPTERPPKKHSPRYCNQILAALSVSLGSLVVGFASSYTSPALPKMNKEHWLGMTEQADSWIGSTMPLSALFGGIAGGPLIEYIGRRNTILATGLPFIAAWLLIVFAVNIPMILVGRILSGFCVGVASLAFPVYLGETLQPEVRGTLGLLPTSFGNIGILLCFVAGKYLSWSQLAMVGACLPVPFMTLMLLIPETPRWYIAKNRKENARESLQWLRGKKCDVNDEMSSIEKAHSESEQNSSSQGAFKELFNKTYKKSVLITLGLMGFQQLSGINAVIFYTVDIFQDAGSTIDGNDCTIIVGVVNFLSTFVATVLIDRLGRKLLLYISSVSMMLTLFTLGTFFYVKELKYDVDSFGWIPLASFVIYVIGFSLGFGPIPWLMMGEILPAKIRGSAASLATAFNWSCTFIVTKTFTDLIHAIHSHGTFWLFGCICLLGLIFVIVFVPETKGKTLEEIELKLTTAGPTSKHSKIKEVNVTEVKSTQPAAIC